MNAFNKVIYNTLGVSVTNFFVWFATVFWMYLQTRNVLATSIMSGASMAMMALSSFWFGSIVDHNKKKRVMVIGSIITLACFAGALAVYLSAPAGALTTIASPYPWIIVGLVFAAFIASNIRSIAIPTLVTMLVPEDRRDKANGLVGMVMGISSMGAGLASGVALAFAGMGWVLGIAVILTAIALVHLLTVSIPEKGIARAEGAPKPSIDIKGTIRHIRAVPGLFALIFFTTFNNFLGGVFAALLDPYGLSLVSVQAWGIIWGILSSGFILGGIYIARKGLGKNPLRRLFMINIITWTSCIFFAIQPSIILLCIGIFVWVCLAPFIEATEHTIVQKVVPLERQGRVIGFAQSIEMTASPITAFMIGPIAQFFFIPFMTTGLGAELIGSWFGTGQGRGIAIIFTLAGIIGLIVTIFAMHSRSYRTLAAQYQK